MTLAALAPLPRNWSAIDQLEALEAQWADSPQPHAYVDVLRQLARDAALDPSALTEWGRRAASGYLGHPDGEIRRRRGEAYRAVLADAPWWILQYAARIDAPGALPDAPRLAHYIAARVLWRAYRRPPVRVLTAAHKPGPTRRDVVAAVTRELGPVDQALVGGLMQGFDLVGLGRGCGLTPQATRRRLIALRRWVGARDGLPPPQRVGRSA